MDRLAAKLRPGNVHSAGDWDELLLPEIEGQQAEGKEVAFRAVERILGQKVHGFMQEGEHFIWAKLAELRSAGVTASVGSV